MGKLRMKETSQERYDREKKEAKELKRKKRRKHRRHRSSSSSSTSSDRGRKPRPSKYYKESSDEEQSTKRDKGKGRSNDDGVNIDSDSYVPPRPSKDRPYVPYSYDDQDDESKLPPPQAHKRDRHSEQDFQERLFDAMREDEGFDPYSDTAARSGMSYDYRESFTRDSRTFGLNGVMSDRYVDPDTGVIMNRVIFKDAMTEDEYADHIRSGMYRRTRREEIARQEELERLKKAKEKKRLEEIERTKALEAERIRKLEERARRKAQAGSVKTREQYQSAWARLVDPKRQTEELQMDEFPWPINQESGGTVDKKSVQDFLLSHLDVDGSLGADTPEISKKKKQAIRTAVLAYHPDRFERYVLRVKEQGGQRESVRQMGLRISQILNEIMQEM